MTTSLRPSQETVLWSLRERFPVGSKVTAVHLGTRRPRSGSAESDVMILGVADDRSVLNISRLVSMVTLDPMTTTRSGQRALRILGRPTHPTVAAVESLSFTLHGRKDALTASTI